MELERGTQIDRYVVESVIGYGGMAAVYKVRHTRLGTCYALKILTLRSASIEERLLREGRVQASLRHPNVVPVIDVLEVDSTPGLVMEFVEGPSLDEFLVGRQLSVEHAVALAYGIVLGVEAAHHEGFIHRDLKPANVMLHLTKDGIVPKVTDFGLAKVVAGDDGLGKTRSGMTMGTPSYMAPEQVRNAKNVDHRADIFALGAILYEMLTGRQAFPGGDVLEIFVKLSNGERTPVYELRGDLPKPLIRAVEGALAIDPEERISDCSVILDLLRQAVDSAVDPRASIGFDASFLEQARELTNEVGRSSVNSLGATQSWVHDEDESGAESGAPISLAEKPDPQPKLPEPAAIPADAPAPSLAEPVAAKASTAEPIATASSSGGGKKVALAGVAVIGLVAVIALAVTGLGATVWYTDLLGSGDAASNEATVAVASKDDEPSAADDTLGDAPSDANPAEVAAAQDDVAVADNATVAADPADAPPVDCADATQFESAATQGKVPVAALACLSRRMRQSSLSQTDRVKSGKVVLRDAKTRCDAGKSCKDYEREQQYFFKEITRSDVEMMFTYTSYLYGLDRYEEVISWAKYTLERKDAWESIQYVQRMPRLLEMRARSEYALFEASPQNARQAKTAAAASVEWGNQLIQLDQVHEPALVLCESASGSRESCEKRMFPEATYSPVSLKSWPPGAAIRVDGEHVGVTPFVADLTHGEHQLEMEMNGKVGKQAISVGTTEAKTWNWSYADDTFEGKL